MGQNTETAMASEQIDRPGSSAGASHGLGCGTPGAFGGSYCSRLGYIVEQPCGHDDTSRDDADRNAQGR